MLPVVAGMNYNPPIRQQTLQIDDFARCVFDNRESLVSGEMGLRDVKIIAATYALGNVLS